MPLTNGSPAFEQRYASHLKHFKLQGLQTETVDAYARAIRTMGVIQERDIVRCAAWASHVSLSRQKDRLKHDPNRQRSALFVAGVAIHVR